MRYEAEKNIRVCRRGKDQRSPLASAQRGIGWLHREYSAQMKGKDELEYLNLGIVGPCCDLLGTTR